MKYKTTRKALVNGGGNFKRAGYCDLSWLLNNHNPVAYTSGVYGWNFDVYEVYGLTITTGYRGMIGERLEGVEEYNKKARFLLSWENKDMSYEEKRAAVEELLKEFCVKNGGVVYE